MKRLTLIALLACCGPATRDDVSVDGAAPVDVFPFPEGVWEPDPGIGRTSAHIVADDSGIWFAYARAGEMAASGVWLTKTTSTGEVLVPPMQIDGPEIAGWPMSIVRSGDNIAVLWEHSSGSLSPRLRLFDRDGHPLSALGNLVPVSTIQETYMTNLALAARSDGSMRMFAAYEYADMTTELAVVELDTAGNPVGQATLFGTADGGTPKGLDAVEVGGNTFVAWDRRYNVCLGYNDPDATVYSTIASDGTVGTPVDINPSGRGDREPALAAAGTTAYLAWTSDTDAGSVIRISRATEPGLGFVELGFAPFGNGSPMLALADATHGAVAWRTDEPTIRVASIGDDGAQLLVGAPHVIAFENTITLRGIVHVGGERYVVSWTDDSFTASRSRLFAVVVDLGTAPKPAPAFLPPSAVSTARRSNRCSH